VGHPEWIAGTEDEYVEKAVALAGDLPRLAALRAGLRQEMQAGPLMDEPAFARKVEGAFRGMFEKWAHAQQNELRGEAR
jgi:predicted O-linked N-acetylglucosamine transferase (SPINDLY family)